MKEIFKALLIMILCMFLTAVLLWAAESIPLWKQVIQTMEIITGYHLTFKDYVHSSFAFTVMYLCIKIIKDILGDNNDNS